MIVIITSSKLNCLIAKYSKLRPIHLAETIASAITSHLVRVWLLFQFFLKSIFMIYFFPIFSKLIFKLIKIYITILNFLYLFFNQKHFFLKNTLNKQTHSETSKSTFNAFSRWRLTPRKPSFKLLKQSKTKILFSLCL